MSTKILKMNLLKDHIFVKELFKNTKLKLKYCRKSFKVIAKILMEPHQLCQEHLIHKDQIILVE
jgi:hypothetical protein